MCCLSSRVAYGVSITSAGLARVERAEVATRAWLDGEGLAVRDLRVRDLGASRARLEVDADLVPVLASRAADVRRVLVGAGFAEAEVDPHGFRSGAMNELLPDPEQFR